MYVQSFRPSQVLYGRWATFDTFNSRQLPCKQDFNVIITVTHGQVAELSTKKSVDSFVSSRIQRSGKCNGGGVVVEPSKKKSVDSAINHFFVCRLKQAIKIRRKRIFP